MFQNKSHELLTVALIDQLFISLRALSVVMSRTDSPEACWKSDEIDHYLASSSHRSAAAPEPSEDSQAFHTEVGATCPLLPPPHPTNNSACRKSTVSRACRYGSTSAAPTSTMGRRPDTYVPPDGGCRVRHCKVRGTTMS